MRVNKTVLYSLLIALLCTISYSTIFFNGFVWDDSRFIVDNPNSRAFDKALNTFTADEFGIYRPVRTLAYFFSYKLFGLNVAYYHLLSILFHATVSILLFLIIRKLFDMRLALLSGILFAIVPIHIERVTNMTGTFDIVGIIFYLLVFYLYILFREKDDKKMLYASIGLFFIGLFSSEEVFTFPLLVIAYEFIFREKGLKKYYTSAPYLVILGLFLMLRFFILGIGAREESYVAGSGFSTFLSMPYALLQYVFLTVLPFGLTPFRKVLIIDSLLHIGFIIPFLVLIAALALVYIFRKDKKVLFFSSWFIITMLPFLNILPLQKIMAERYFYLASLSVLALLAALFIYLKEKMRNLSYIPFVILVLFFISLTVYNNSFWKDEKTLMSRGIALNPEDSKAHNNLGTYYFSEGDTNRSVIHFLSAVTYDNKNSEAWMNLGVAYSKKGEYNKSIEALQKAVAINANNFKAYDKMGITYLRQENNKKAEEMFKMAITLNKEYYPAYSHLGALYGNSGNVSLALSYLQEAIEVNPNYAEAYYNIGLLLKNTGNEKDAQAYLNKAKQLS